MRRSITGPLFIILIGSLLLAQNFLDDFSIWSAFARHWPWLLIAWGGLRLAEHGWRAAQGEPGPAPMRVGALILAVLLCAAGSAAHAIERAEWRGDFELLWSGMKRVEPAHTVPVAESWPAAGVQTLEIDGYLGELRLMGDEGDSIRLEGARKIAAATPEEARHATATSPVGFVVTDGTARLSPSGGAQRRFSGEFVVYAPRSLAIHVRDGDGELSLRDFDGAATVEAAGVVEAEDIAGSVEVRLRRGRRFKANRIAGDVQLEGGAHTVEVQEAAGAVRLTGDQFGRIAISSAGPLEIATRRLEVQAPAGVSGPLEVTMQERWRIEASALGGPAKLIGNRGEARVELGPGPIQDLEVRLESGDIELRLPPGADFELEAQATEIENALPKAAEGGGGPLKLASGSGGAKIRLQAERGRIRLEPASGER